MCTATSYQTFKTPKINTYEYLFHAYKNLTSTLPHSCTYFDVHFSYLKNLTIKYLTKPCKYLLSPHLDVFIFYQIEDFWTIFGNLSELSDTEMEEENDSKNASGLSKNSAHALISALDKAQKDVALAVNKLLEHQLPMSLIAVTTASEEKFKEVHEVVEVRDESYKEFLYYQKKVDKIEESNTENPKEVFACKSIQHPQCFAPFHCAQCNAIMTYFTAGAKGTQRKEICKCGSSLQRQPQAGKRAR